MLIIQVSQNKIPLCTFVQFNISLHCLSLSLTIVLLLYSLSFTLKPKDFDILSWLHTHISPSVKLVVPDNVFPLMCLRLLNISLYICLIKLLLKYELQKWTFCHTVILIIVISTFVTYRCSVLRGTEPIPGCIGQAWTSHRDNTYRLTTTFTLCYCLLSLLLTQVQLIKTLVYCGLKWCCGCRKESSVG